MGGNKIATPTQNSTNVTFFLKPADDFIAALTKDSKWGGGPGTPVTLTYSIPQNDSFWDPTYSNLNEPFVGFFGLFPTEEQAFENALSKWSDVANITFTQVADNASTVGEIRIALSTTVDASAHAYLPSNQPHAGDIWLNPDVYTPSTSLAEGTFEFETLMHEIGHSLGLKHPFDSEGSWSTTLPDQFDSIFYTVMSYTADPNGDSSLYADRYPTTPMIFDIAAIQYLYGANTSFNSGNNTYTYTSSGKYFETIWDGGGVDKIVYQGSSGGIIDLRPLGWSHLGQPVNLINQFGSTVNQVTATVAIAGGVIIENADGSDGNDLIIGNSVANILNGNGGADTIYGEEGNDNLIGGDGDDTLYGGDGDDTLKGGAGADVLTGGSGADIFIVDDDDTVTDFNAAEGDTIEDSGGSGDGDGDGDGDGGSSDVDILDASKVSTLILAATFNHSSSGYEKINGAAGGTVLTGDGSAGLNWDFTDIELNNITLKGTFLADRITGSTGNDVIKGSWGKDTLSGGDGDDTLKGGRGGDFISGNDGDDFLKGGRGKDVLKGGDDNDFLKGGKGADDINGDAGNDTLIGGQGRDTLDGGDGSDTYIVAAAENKVDTYQDSGSSGVDILDASSVSTLILPANFNHSGSGLEEINGTADGTVLTGDGNAGLNWDFTDIELNNITLKGTFLADRITGSTGNDVIKGSWGKDTLSGGDGDDTLKGGRGGDFISGNDGDDFLKGGRGKDTLVGGDGDDTLKGGLGTDTLTGDAGADIFIIKGVDTVNDFDHAEGDELQLNGGIGLNQFQWGFQSPGATRANTFGAITSDFLLEATNKGALLGAVASAASSLFGNTIASGVSSVGYFFGLTNANDGLYYIIANQHTETASVTTTFSTVTVAILEGITGLGTGINQIAQSDIILF